MKVSCGPVIRYQPMPLGCELHKNFWVFSKYLDGRGWLMWVGIVDFPSLCQLGCNSISGYVWLLVSPEAELIKNRVTWHISKFFLFPSFCRKQRGFFLQCSLWEPSQPPGSKSPNIAGYPLHQQLVLHEVFNFQGLATLSLQQLVNCSFSFPTMAFVPVAASFLSLCSGKS